MNVEIHIPTALRPQTNGCEKVTVQGSTVREALTALVAKFPDLSHKLFKDHNSINRFINIYVNDEDIRFMDNLDTELNSGSEISIVPAIAGG